MTDETAATGTGTGVGANAGMESVATPTSKSDIEAAIAAAESTIEETVIARPPPLESTPSVAISPAPTAPTVYTARPVLPRSDSVTIATDSIHEDVVHKKPLPGPSTAATLP